jgi:hypothetical protein
MRFNNEFKLGNAAIMSKLFSAVAKPCETTHVLFSLQGENPDAPPALQDTSEWWGDPIVLPGKIAC